MPYMPGLKATVLLSLATLCAAAYGQDANPAGPGTLNYVEGQVSLNGQSLNSKSVGSTTLEPGQTITTSNGKAEILLTPGVFLRLGDHSTLTMVTPNLTNTEVHLQQGKANVEVDELYKQNHIAIDQNGQQSVLLKNGLYGFNAGDRTMRVFDGKAAVFHNDEPAGTPGDPQKPTLVKGGHELALAGDGVQPTKFDKDAAKDTDLYKWSSLRSQYLGEANANLAYSYAGAGPINPGWFWSSGLYGYTWLPGDGAFLSPFGYGFYSPYYLYGGGPFIGRGYYGGYRGGLRAGNYGLRSPAARAGANAGFRGNSSIGAGGGFHGGSLGGAGLRAGGGGHR